MKLRRIEILERDKNKKGDLFGRLMGDLFHALGYGEPRLNVHKSGREVDIQASHRTEKKVAIAECKAHREPRGGADINKFVGVLDSERRSIQKKVSPEIDAVGYFVSIAGFKETAIEQEEENGNNRIILVGPQKIAEELVNGRIIVSPEKAISVVEYDPERLSLLEEVDLFAYERGWVWGLYFSDNGGQKATHFSLVHADGKPLIKDLADEVIERDGSNLKLLSGLQYIIPSKDPGGIEEAKSAYFKYLENECGEIQFEGLPTDKDAAVKVKLENIFVPLNLDPFKENRKEGEFEFRKGDSVGRILQYHRRLAILAKPGGGKSTLIKRIALAYAFKQRREEVADNLPDLEWFPIFIRCRELGDFVRKSITETILNIPNRAEIGQFKEQFSVLVSDALQKGSALLLIDGLDEITDDRKRITFVNQLRTFLATYPNINIVVTSREAGFRAVAGTLATYCEHYTIAKLNETEITDLTVKWHKAVIDQSEKTINEARSLAAQIILENRIRALAENPLLLTTLLFVKRWIGYLPTKKHVLYQEMIKLLLVTWNVEGNEPMDIEESEPQLSYVAYWMTLHGKQTINESDLKKCLADARTEMPEILEYTRVSISEFIKNVENRSSLLIMSGHENIEDGRTIPIYEFLHLSFQEYLTAKAIVEGFTPAEVRNRSTLEVIKPHLESENWREVVPLVTILSRSKSREIITYLRDSTRDFANGSKDRASQMPSLLMNCIAMEVQITGDLLESSIEWVCQSGFYFVDRSVLEVILNSKFADTFRKKVTELASSFEKKFFVLRALSLGAIQLNEWYGRTSNEILSEIIEKLTSDDRVMRLSAVSALTIINIELLGEPPVRSADLDLAEVYVKFLRMLETDDRHLKVLICWCLYWREGKVEIPDPTGFEFARKILPFWIAERRTEFSSIAQRGLIGLIRPWHEFDKVVLKKVAKIIDSEPDTTIFPELILLLEVVLKRNVDMSSAEKVLEELRFQSENTRRAFADHLGINARWNFPRFKKSTR